MPDTTVNLTFHGIGEPVRQMEPGEDLVWLDTGQFEAALDAVAGRDDVRITFDDGNASDLEIALPALLERGLTATFFVVAGKLGTPGFLDEQGVRALAEAGMTIGSHGMRHCAWRRLDEIGLREEFDEARRLLEEIVERPVTEAACPFGAYDRRVLGSLRRRGYERVYTSDRGSCRSDDWLQPRNTIGPHDDARRLSHVLAPGQSPRGPLRRRAKLAVKRWR